jgi:hypothetical protein
MIAILPQESNIWDLLGGGLGQGIAQGAQQQQQLSGLLALEQEKQQGTLAEKLLAAQQKLGERESRKAAFTQLGLDPALADLDPRIAAEYAKDQLFSNLMGGIPGQIGKPMIETAENGETDTDSKKRTPSNQLEAMTDSQLRQLVGHPRAGKMAESELNRRLEDNKREFTEKTKFEERAFKRNEKFFENLDKEVKDFPKKQLALTQMREAVDSDEFSNYRNAIGDYLGLPFLKNAPANTVNSAIKEFLISDLASISGRPNQFIEKQMSQALINPQYSKQANEAILFGLEGLFNLKKREFEIASKLEDDFVSKGKEVPRNFQKIVRDKMKDEIEKFDESYTTKIKQLFKGISQKKPSVEEKIGLIEDGMITVKTKDGRIGKVPFEQYDIMKRDGVLAE